MFNLYKIKTELTLTCPLLAAWTCYKLRLRNQTVHHCDNKDSGFNAMYYYVLFIPGLCMLI